MKFDSAVLRTALVCLILAVAGNHLLISGPDVEGSIAFQLDIPIDQDTTATAHHSPDIETYENDVYIVWHDDRNGTDDIFFRASKDGGTTFGPEVRVDDTLRNDVAWDDQSQQRRPRLTVAENGTIYVVWEDDREGKDLIHMATSTDGGETFSTNFMLDWSLDGLQTNPAITCSDDGVVYVVWEDNRNRVDVHQIYMSYLLEGALFTSGVRVSDTDLQYDCRHPAVAASSDGRVHVAWEDDRTWDVDIYMASSEDGGVSFSESVRVNVDPTSSDQGEVDVAANDDKVVAVWRETKMGSADIYMAVSLDNGTSFGTNTLVNKEANLGAQIEPVIDMDGYGNMMIVWSNSSGTADIEMKSYYANGTDDGVYKVNDPVPSTTQDQPRAVLSSTGVGHVVWRDNRDSGVKHIYYTKNETFGETGKAPVLSKEKVSPELGAAGDTFTFTVKYEDEEGEAPDKGYPKLHLKYRIVGGLMFDYPGSPFEMSMRMVPPPGEEKPDMDFRNGEYYIQKVVIDRDVDLYYYISAVAEDGNQTMVNTTMHHLPVVDGEPPTFKLVAPQPEEWSVDYFVTCTVDINDTESGVDPWSVAYKLYQPQTNEWSKWYTKGSFEQLPDGSLRFSTDVSLQEGQGNLILFRAKDKLGNGGEDDDFAYSDPYTIWVDPRGPEIYEVKPLSGSVFKDTDVEFTAKLRDAGAGLDPDSVMFSYSIDGISGFGDWINVSNIPGSKLEEVEDHYELTFRQYLSWGDFNFFKLKARDVLGNEYETVPAQVIIRQSIDEVGDRPPGPVGSIQPRVTGSVRPHITWSRSVDPDGDQVNYWLRVHLSENGSIVQDWTLITEGTFWDPSLDQTFQVGAEYVVTVVPTARGKNGTATNSTLKVSFDANRPPLPVEGMEPGATGDTSPLITWQPSSDPEGDLVYYFIRIRRWMDVRDIVPWTSVLDDTRYLVTKVLVVGIYEVEIMCSDGKDFSPISTFSMSVGVFDPQIRTKGTTLVIPQGSSASLNLTITNLGYMPDTIGLSLSGEAEKMEDLEIYLSRDEVELYSGSSINSTLTVSAADYSVPGIYMLNVTATSADGVSFDTQAIVVRVIDPDDISQDGGGTTSEPDEGTDTGLIILLLLIAVVIIVLIALGYGYWRVDRRIREEQVEVVKDKKKGMEAPESRSTLEGEKEKKKLKGRSGKKKSRDLPPAKRSKVEKDEED